MVDGPRPFDRAAVARAMRELIAALGLDPAREPELVQTPDRVAELYAEVLAGVDPATAPELATFPAPSGVTHDDLVVVRDLPFHALCVHHFVPFFGHAHIAYLPDRRWLGISGFARLLAHHAHRPQLQERLGAELADDLMTRLGARGVSVTLVARHLCMEMRGIRTTGTVETHARRGVLASAEWAARLPRTRSDGPTTS